MFNVDILKSALYTLTWLKRKHLIVTFQYYRHIKTKYLYVWRKLNIFICPGVINKTKLYYQM